MGGNDNAGNDEEQLLESDEQLFHLEGCGESYDVQQAPFRRAKCLSFLYTAYKPASGAAATLSKVRALASLTLTSPFSATTHMALSALCRGLQSQGITAYVVYPPAASIHAFPMQSQVRPGTPYLVVSSSPTFPAPSALQASAMERQNDRPAACARQTVTPDPSIRKYCARAMVPCGAGSLPQGSSSAPATGPPLVLHDLVVVEPCLQDLFVLGGSVSERYADRLAEVPRLFVGTYAQLMDTADAMATAVALHFSQLGLTPPPWRTHKAICARWAPDVIAAAMATPGKPAMSSPSAPDTQPVSVCSASPAQPVACAPARPASGCMIPSALPARSHGLDEAASIGLGVRHMGGMLPSPSSAIASAAAPAPASFELPCPAWSAACTPSCSTLLAAAPAVPTAAAAPPGSLLGQLLGRQMVLLASPPGLGAAMQDAARSSQPSVDRPPRALFTHCALGEHTSIAPGHQRQDAARGIESTDSSGHGRTAASSALGLEFSGSMGSDVLSPRSFSLSGLLACSADTAAGERCAQGAADAIVLWGPGGAGSAGKGPDATTMVHGSSACLRPQAAIACKHMGPPHPVVLGFCVRS